MKLLTFVALIALIVPSAFAHEGTENAPVIHMRDTGFEPDRLGIVVGTAVTFENVGNNPHWPASNIHPTHGVYPEFDPKDVVQPGASWSFTFNQPGTWKCHDHAYPELTCVIKVTGADEETGSFRALLRKTFALLALLPGQPPLAGLFAAEMPKKYAPPQRVYDDTIVQGAESLFSDDTALYSHVKKYGPHDTVKQLYALSQKFGDCHQQAHQAGRFAYEIYDAEAFQTCSAECHSGCYHGATEAYFHAHGTENLVENLKTICGSVDNPFFSHQCVHGIGHGLTAWLDYDVPAALKACDAMAPQTGSCNTGVFMENIVGGLAADEANTNNGHVTRYLSNDPHYPCNVVEEKYKWDCYFYQTSRMKELFNHDFSKIALACATLSDTYQVPCFESMGRDASGNHNQNPEAAIRECMFAPAGRMRAHCMGGAVQDTFWDEHGQDRALHFCAILTDAQEKESCYKVIADRAKSVLQTSDDKKAFCSRAEPQFRQQCALLAGV